MSRHRNIRSMNYDEEYYGYDDVYGHSVEDDYATSPSAAQFMYNRDQAHQMSAYLHTEEDIKEEDEEDDKEMHSLEKRDSSVTLPPLGDMEKAQLYSCLDVIRDRLGDSVSEQSAVNAILSHNFDVDKAVNALLSQTTPKAPAVQPLKRETQITTLKAEAEPVAADRTVKVVTANNRVVVSTGFALPEENLVQGVQDATRQMESLKTSNNNSRSASPAAREAIPVSIPATPKTPAKPREVRPDAATEYAKERGSGKALLNLVVVGHVDAGKSTLMGHMLYKLGQVSSKAMHKFEQESKKLGKQSFMYAWVLDETGEERSRGITMDVGQSQFETDTKSVTLLDAPGHRDFIPNMIFGAAQADVALLVVDATTGEFETGFESGGQTREHALLVRSLGVNQLGVAVNKMDTVGWSRERFEDITKRLGAFLKQAGFKEADVVYVPVSGLSGENLVTRCEDPRLTTWYSGPTLLQVVDNFRPPERPLSKPFRMVVSDIFKSTGSTSGCCLAGRVEGGMVSVGDKVLLMPLNEPVQVKSLLLVDRSATSAFAGDQITLTVTGPDPSNISLGAVLCDPTDPIKVATRIEARIVIFNIDVPITKGFPVVLHYQSLSEAATIRKLVAQIHKSTGEVIKSRPRCLGKQTSGLVELEINKPVCIELYKDFRELGRFMLRAGGTTIAAGLVTKIF